MSGGPSPIPEKSLLVRLREAMPPGVKVDVMGNDYVLRTAPPEYRLIAKRPLKVVQSWRNPESTLAHVARDEMRSKGIEL